MLPQQQVQSLLTSVLSMVKMIQVWEVQEQSLTFFLYMTQTNMEVQLSTGGGKQQLRTRQEQIRLMLTCMTRQPMRFWLPIDTQLMRILTR